MSSLVGKGMRSLLRSTAGLFGLALVALLVFSQLGFADIRWPWERVDITSAKTTIDQPEAARVTEIEPIALDCRARIHTTVPIEGRREHRVLGQVYRTDTVSMTAIGDIDTCVGSNLVRVVNHDDGTASVTVPADAIRFVRPRVDAAATADSVEFDGGLFGKLADVFPWVSDNNGLTPAAYAYAQAVVGSSECMAEAYDLTEVALRDAYEAEMLAQGFDPADIDVEITGTPDFGPTVAEAADTGGYGFEIGDGGATCEVAPDAYRSAPSADDERQ